MYSGTGTRALPRVGFPIRISRDQRLVSTYSGLFAAAHVLHRLLAPRHPPCALILLIVKNSLCCRYGVFKVHARFRAQLKNRPRRPVSQSSAANAEQTVAQAKPAQPSVSTSQATSRYVEVD